VKGRSTLLVAGADGSGVRTLTQPGADAGLPAWSPDGRRLALVIADAGTRQIATINADGSLLRRLTGPVGYSTAPVWSPDGRQIAFVSRRDHPQPELYVMRADGGGQNRLTTGGVLLRPGVLHPVWLPGGGRLAYVSRVGRGEQAIWMVDATGGSPQRISTGYAPAWSRDGRRLAFVVARVGDAQIFVMDASGKNVRRLTPAGTHLLPAWSPDGRWIAFVSIRGSDLALWIMRPDGTDQRRLVAISGDLSLLPLYAWRPR
jgi:TolB protein